MAAPFQNLPEQRRLLDAIASGESTGYDIIYGGGRFTGYSDHPRQAIPIPSGPNQGKTSSAAGRYQFLAPTWDEVAKELGLKDFSPDSQDMAAWHLAAKTYAGKTGRDLLTDLREGNTQGIAPALSGVWTSIPGGIEPNKATTGFAGRLTPPTGAPPVFAGPAPQQAQAPAQAVNSWSPPAATPAVNVPPALTSLNAGAVAAGDPSRSFLSMLPAQASLADLPPVVRQKIAAMAPRYGKGFY